eukprot:Skav229060  [mRNA]  locus=scaffold2611:121268:124484:+ [translate_table: standard]
MHVHHVGGNVGGCTVAIRGPGVTLVVDSFHPEMAAALQEAARHGDLRALERTLSGWLETQETARILGQTAFQLVLDLVQHGLTVLRLLFRAAALLEQATPHGRSPLFVAAQRGTLWQRRWNVDAARARAPRGPRVLCELNADLEKPRRKSQFVGQRSGGHTPLMAACREGHSEVAQLLCEKGAEKELMRGDPSAKPTDVLWLLVKHFGSELGHDMS